MNNPSCALSSSSSVGVASEVRSLARPGSSLSSTPSGEEAFRPPSKNQGDLACSSVEEGLNLYTKDLIKRARHLTGCPTEAQELVQETALRALRFKHKYHPETHARAWLMRIMHNLFISQKRRQSVERKVRERLQVDPNSWVSRRSVQPMTSLVRPLVQAMNGLPERLSEVVTLVDICEFSYQEAASTQGVPLGTVMSRLHRARARLCRELSDEKAASSLCDSRGISSAA